VRNPKIAGRPQSDSLKKCSDGGGSERRTGVDREKYAKGLIVEVFHGFDQTKEKKVGERKTGNCKPLPFFERSSTDAWNIGGRIEKAKKRLSQTVIG